MKRYQNIEMKTFCGDLIFFKEKITTYYVQTLNGEIIIFQKKYYFLSNFKNCT